MAIDRTISVPRARPPIIPWGIENVKVDGHSFSAERTPQLIEPIESMVDKPTRIGTLVKPVQIGGSTAAELVCSYWCAFWYGLIQFNWENDDKAKKRWLDRILTVLRSVTGILRTGDRFEETLMEAHYKNTTLRVQGVYDETRLDSDTVPLQLNEEIHGWKPGHLAKARARQTQVWNSKAFDVSNASRVGDQLFLAYEDGTMEQWETLCPGCGQYHVMRTRWEDEKPELGGLRYDSANCDMGNGKFNYNKLVPTIRYQMPCGFLIHNTPRERRALNFGRYSEPQNTGALLSHRSWNFEAVSCAAVDWVDLIRDKHTALRALKAGDAAPWMRYITERECKFFGEQSIPYSGQTIYNLTLKKNRVGLAGRSYRSATADWQQGYKAKGQLQHYWLLIEDVMPNCDSQIVFEGKAESDAELLAEVDAHEVPRPAVWIDCSKNTKAILQLCYQQGMNAVNLQLSRTGSFLHEDGVRRFYSPGKPIHAELNTPPVFPYVPRRNKSGDYERQPNHEEPTVVSLNKAGLLSNHFFIRNMEANVKAQDPKAAPEAYIHVDIPADVSEDFKAQNEAWEYLPGHKPKNQEDGIEGFRQRSRNDHLLMCRAYSDFLKEWLGLLGDRLAQLGIKQT